MHEDGYKADKATLYVVATPIGNLRDLSLRALDILGSVDVIAAEDTRVTAKLLSHYGISKKLVSLREHNEKRSIETITEILAKGHSVALVSDAGTPAVSDPGAVLVAGIREAGYKVIPIPGANAAIAALSAAGITAPHFLFFGFPASQAGLRRKELEAVKGLTYPIIFYESPHRIGATLGDMQKIFGGDRKITLARELTKVFETMHRCSLDEMLIWIQADANQTRGEFVLIVNGAEAAQDSSEAEVRRVLGLLMPELNVTHAVKLTHEITGEKKNKVYEIALALKENE